MSRNLGWWERVPNESFFCGSGDVEEYLTWERNMERIFWCHPFTSREMVFKATDLLMGRALAWWDGNMEIRRSEPPISTWTSMKHELRAKYVPNSHYTVLRRKFHKIFQGGKSVEKYYREYSQLQSLLGIDYPEWELMEHFMEGLNDETYQMAQRRHHHSLRELVRYLTETNLGGIRREAPQVSQPIPFPRYDSGLSSTSKPVPSSPETPQQKDGRELTHEGHFIVQVGRLKGGEEQELVFPEPPLEEQNVALSVEPFPVVETIIVATPQVHEDLGSTKIDRAQHRDEKLIAVGKHPRPGFIPIKRNRCLQAPFDPGKLQFPLSI